MGNNNSGASTCAGGCSRPNRGQSIVTQLQTREPSFQISNSKWASLVDDPEVIDDPIVSFNLNQLNHLENKMASLVEEDPLQTQQEKFKITSAKLTVMGALVHHLGTKVTMQASRQSPSREQQANLFFDLLKMLIENHNEALDFVIWALGDLGKSSSLLAPQSLVPSFKSARLSQKHNFSQVAGKGRNQTQGLDLQHLIQPQETHSHLKGSVLQIETYDNPSGQEEYVSRQLQSFNEQRFVDLLENLDFLFNGKLLVRALKQRKELLESLTELYFLVSDQNLDFKRKLAWKLSKLNLKASKEQQENFNFLEALTQSEKSHEFFQTYKRLTKEISRHPILQRFMFLSEKQFLTRQEFELTKAQILGTREEQLLLLQQIRSQSPIQSSSYNFDIQVKQAKLINQQLAQSDTQSHDPKNTFHPIDNHNFTERLDSKDSHAFGPFKSNIPELHCDPLSMEGSSDFLPDFGSPKQPNSIQEPPDDPFGESSSKETPKQVSRFPQRSSKNMKPVGEINALSIISEEKPQTHTVNSKVIQSPEFVRTHAKLEKKDQPEEPARTSPSSSPSFNFAQFKRPYQPTPQDVKILQGLYGHRVEFLEEFKSGEEDIKSSFGDQAIQNPNKVQISNSKNQLTSNSEDKDPFPLAEHLPQKKTPRQFVAVPKAKAQPKKNFLLKNKQNVKNQKRKHVSLVVPDLPHPEDQGEQEESSEDNTLPNDKSLHNNSTQKPMDPVRLQVDGMSKTKNERSVRESPLRLLNQVSVRMGESEEENRFVVRQSSFEPSPAQQQQLCRMEAKDDEPLRDPRQRLPTKESDEGPARINSNESNTSSTFMIIKDGVANIGSGIVAVVSKPPLRAKSVKRKPQQRSQSLHKKVALSQERSSQQRYLDHIFSKKAEDYHPPGGTYFKNADINLVEDNSMSKAKGSTQTSQKFDQTLSEAEPMEQRLVSEEDAAKIKLSSSNFQPLRKLGMGAFGDVYLVRKVSTGKLFAMKVLNRHSPDANWIRYVRSERDILAQIKSPYLCKLNFAFQSDSKLFLVMDFYPGGDLETLLQQEQYLSEDTAKVYTAELVLAIAELHSKNIIYRDLKPDNVVLKEDGHISLIDFGMAKQGVPSYEEGATTFCGSLKYLAPEMLRKTGHGKALDWYLLGVLFYEMLVGVTPYYSQAKEDLFENILFGKLKLPRTIRPQARDLIVKLLNRNPSRRLGSFRMDEAILYESNPSLAGMPSQLRDAFEVMAHPFFKDINWPNLLHQVYSGLGSFSNMARRSKDYFSDKYKTTRLSQQEISKIYSDPRSKPQQEPALENWSFYDDQVLLDEQASSPAKTAELRCQRTLSSYKKKNPENETLRSRVSIESITEADITLLNRRTGPKTRSKSPNEKRRQSVKRSVKRKASPMSRKSSVPRSASLERGLSLVSMGKRSFQSQFVAKKRTSSHSQRSSPLKQDARRQREKSAQLSQPKHKKPAVMSPPPSFKPRSQSRKKGKVPKKGSPKPLPKFESKQIHIRLERGRNNELDIKSTETTVISSKIGGRSKSRPKKLKRPISNHNTKNQKLPRVALLASKKDEKPTAKPSRVSNKKKV